MVEFLLVLNGRSRFWREEVDTADEAVAAYKEMHATLERGEALNVYKTVPHLQAITLNLGLSRWCRRDDRRSRHRSRHPEDRP